jgi:YHS domain-containing protein
MPFLSSKKIKWTVISLLIVMVMVGSGVFIWVQTSTGAIKNQVNIDEFGIAIQGYDTVAYHLEKRPVEGKSEFAFEWNDAAWHFASTENRDLFAADPERYAPQYGGY